MKPVGLKIILLLLLAFSITVTQAEAVSMGKIVAGAPTEERNKGYAVGIILSKTCITLVKAGKDTCPSYRDLATLDNSVPEYSGAFKETDGFYHRVPPKYPNTMGFYQYDPTFRIFVDPPKTAKMPLITIEAQLQEYHIEGQFKINEIKDYSLKDSKATKSVRSYSHTRYVDPTCSYATITSENWQKILPDTIHFMRNNCDPNQTQILTLGSDIKRLTTHDITTTAKYKLEKLYDTIKRECLKEYGKCDTISQATRAGIDDTPEPSHYAISLTG